VSGEGVRGVGFSEGTRASLYMQRADVIEAESERIGVLTIRYSWQDVQGEPPHDRDALVSDKGSSLGSRDKDGSYLPEIP